MAHETGTDDPDRSALANGYRLWTALDSLSLPHAEEQGPDHALRSRVEHELDESPRFDLAALIDRQLEPVIHGVGREPRRRIVPVGFSRDHRVGTGERLEAGWRMHFS